MMQRTSYWKASPDITSGGDLGPQCLLLTLVVGVEFGCLDRRQGPWCFLPKLKTSDCHWKLRKRWRDSEFSAIKEEVPKHGSDYGWRMHFSLPSHKQPGVPFYLLKRMIEDLICLFNVQLLPVAAALCNTKRNTFLANSPQTACWHIIKSFKYICRRQYCVSNINVEQWFKQFQTKLAWFQLITDTRKENQHLGSKKGEDKVT